MACLVGATLPLVACGGAPPAAPPELTSACAGHTCSGGSTPTSPTDPSLAPTVSPPSASSVPAKESPSPEAGILPDAATVPVGATPPPAPPSTPLPDAASEGSTLTAVDIDAGTMVSVPEVDAGPDAPVMAVLQTDAAPLPDPCAGASGGSTPTMVPRAYPGGGGIGCARLAGTGTSVPCQCFVTAGEGGTLTATALALTVCGPTGCNCIANDGEGPADRPYCIGPKCTADQIANQTCWY